MRVVDIPSGRYTAFIPEGLLDRLALRRIPGLERVSIPILCIRDLVAQDYSPNAGTCLVRRWTDDVVRNLQRQERIK